MYTGNSNKYLVPGLHERCVHQYHAADTERTMFSSLAGRQTVSHIFANRIVNLVELLIGNLQEPWLCGEETMISTPAQFVHMRTPHSPSNSGGSGTSRQGRKWRRISWPSTRRTVLIDKIRGILHLITIVSQTPKILGGAGRHQASSGRKCMCQNASLESLHMIHPLKAFCSCLPEQQVLQLLCFPGVYPFLWYIRESTRSGPLVEQFWQEECWHTLAICMFAWNLLASWSSCDPLQSLEAESKQKIIDKMVEACFIVAQIWSALSQALL